MFFCSCTQANAGEETFACSGSDYATLHSTHGAPDFEIREPPVLTNHTHTAHTFNTEPVMGLNPGGTFAYEREYCLHH